MKTRTLRTYSELVLLPTFKERFMYLKIGGRIGQETFGFDRVFNQKFYTSLEWKHVRDFVVARDLGCDLGVEGFDIRGTRFVIHHMNPITLEDFESRSDILLDPEYLITTTHRTHNAIHYSDDSILKGFEIIERKPNDTCPWKNIEKGG